MGRRRAAREDAVDIEGALAALDAPALRSLVRELLDAVEPQDRALAVRALVERAARAGTGWSPPAVSERAVAASLSFARAALRAGHADPADVDAHLGRASDAFLRRDYATALRVFGALLGPIGDGDIDLGQDEMAYEVLGADLGGCAAQFVVSAYMASAPAERPAAVHVAIQKARGVGHLREPIAEMERVAVEPLPDLEAFLPRWRTLVANEAAGRRAEGWGGAGAWLREVAERLEGAAGLAAVARASGSAEDLRAWCRRLVSAADWRAALEAFEEAAGRVDDSEYARADFLDGAALAAEKLGSPDVPARLERAWRAEPTMLRLARWLATAASPADFRERPLAALETCPKDEGRQRALLHVLAGDLPAAAKLLASAPGLGWSSEDHPGHLLLPVFRALLAGKELSIATLRFSGHVADLGAFDDLDDVAEDEAGGDRGARSTIEAPDLHDLLARAGVRSVMKPEVREALLKAMRKAAERRLAGVTEHKRRRYYDHAAELVATVVACDPSPATTRWAAGLRATYNRYPALRGALDRHVGRASGKDTVR